MTLKGRQESFFLLYLFIQDNLFPFAHMQAIGDSLEGSLLKTSERHSLPESKVHCHFAEKSAPALITAFLLLLLIFFLDMQHLLPSEKCSSCVQLYFCPREEASPFLTFYSCHATTRNLDIWFLQNFKTVR